MEPIRAAASGSNERQGAVTVNGLTTMMNQVSAMLATTAPTASPYQNTSVELVVGMLLFGLAGFALAFVGLSIGRLVRPQLYHPEKMEPYECGEPAIGESWVQFDLRFYTVALVFIVFDVEVALLWPWAVAFKHVGAPAFWAFFVFFLLLAVPFLYEWKSGYLEWVRSYASQERTASPDAAAEAGGGAQRRA